MEANFPGFFDLVRLHERSRAFSAHKRIAEKSRRPPFIKKEECK